METKKLIKKIKQVLWITKSIDENENMTKWYIKTFCDFHHFNLGSLGVHLIETVTRKHSIIVTIALSRPGLLIGKAGRIIDALTKALSKYSGKPVEIKIVEFDPFRFRY